MKYYISIFLFIFAIAACETAPVETEPADYANADLLIDAEELNTIIPGEGVIVIDAREEPGDTLVPGSVHFAARSELVDSDHPIEQYLIGPDAFESKMQSIGLSNNSRVFIYDSGDHLSSARLFYALEYYGFGNAAVVNGGIQGWLDASLPIESQHITLNEGDFEVTVNETLMCDFETVVAASQNENQVIFDARTPEEYSGETVRAERGGHIPNAVNFEWNKALQSEGIPYYLPADSIQAMLNEFGITPDKEIITHCQSNVRGSHAYFTLRLMGYDSVRAYEGSWFEYGNREDAVVEN
jgi:thiosulfate/3-mercaptopyruvate sulfurtransferase